MRLGVTYAQIVATATLIIAGQKVCFICSDPQKECLFWIKVYSLIYEIEHG